MDVKCGREGAATEMMWIALLMRIGRVVPAPPRPANWRQLFNRRARAAPSAGLNCGARLRAHPGEGLVSQCALGCGRNPGAVSLWFIGFRIPDIA